MSERAKPILCPECHDDCIGQHRLTLKGRAFRWWYKCYYCDHRWIASEQSPVIQDTKP